MEFSVLSKNSSALFAVAPHTNVHYIGLCVIVSTPVKLPYWNGGDRRVVCRGHAGY